MVTFLAAIPCCTVVTVLTLLSLFLILLLLHLVLFLVLFTSLVGARMRIWKDREGDRALTRHNGKGGESRRGMSSTFRGEKGDCDVQRGVWGFAPHTCQPTPKKK